MRLYKVKILHTLCTNVEVAQHFHIFTICSVKEYSWKINGLNASKGYHGKFV